MNRIDTKSMLIGIVLSTIAVLCVAAVSDINSGRYNVSICAGSAPGTFIVCTADTSTGKYALDRCVEQIPASSSMMTHIGIFNNQLTGK